MIWIAGEYYMLSLKKEEGKSIYIYYISHHLDKPFKVIITQI